MTAFILPSGFFNGSHLGPQVLRIPRIAVEFDRNEVILVVMGGFLSVYRVDRGFNVGLGDLGIRRAGGRLRVRIEIAWAYARGCVGLREGAMVRSKDPARTRPP